MSWLVRWMAAALVAIGLGMAGLELTTCIASERRAAAPGMFTDAIEPELPGSVEEELAPSALPRMIR
jgi:hypothetical protein